MLSLQTSDDWAAAQVTIQVGVNSATWTCPSTANSAVDAANDLVTWANDGARPWAGAVVFGWSWARQPGTGGALLELQASVGVFSYTPNTAAQVLLGIGAAVNRAAATGNLPAAGTWAPGPSGYVALKLGEAWLKGAGQASAVGAVRPGVPGLAAWVARCQPVVKAQDVARLTYVLGDASHPRRAWMRLSNVGERLGSFAELVTDPDTATGWRLVALGQVQRAPVGVGLWRCELAVAGEAV